MANQDPQPEVYTVTSQFARNTPADTQLVTNIITSQANNEEVRIYAMKVNIVSYDAVTGATVNLDPETADNCDFNITITVGANNVPSQVFSVRPTWVSSTRTLIFATPVLVLFQQPFRITVNCVSGTLNAADTDGRQITLEFESELAIQKVAC
jgi:hypothetical protein